MYSFSAMYSTREVSAVLGITVTRLRSYLRAGLASPGRNEAGQLSFTFHDLLKLREAHGLVGKRFAPKRIHRVLRALQARLPTGTSVAAYRLSSEGRDIIVEDDGRRWNADSGQVLFNFAHAEPDDQGGEVIPFGKPRTTPAETPTPMPLSPRELYDQACALEAGSPEEAKAAYRVLLEREPEYADAHVNLGRLLHESNDIYAALVHYRAALAIRPSDPTASFNSGVALEDLGANADAITAYRRAIECDPRNPDAHYNLARLLEQSGKPDLAVRHLLLYRQLVKKR